MKLILIISALIMSCAPAVSQAYARTVICDGCGEAEYAKTALRSAAGADSILVMDGANAELRKFRVSRSSEQESGRYRTTVSRTEPTAKEWSAFEEMISLYDVVRFHLDSCGPGGLGDFLVPDFNVSWACEQHDDCYSAGGNSGNRAQCDQQLYNDMISLGATVGLATAYYLAVRAAGWLYFNYSSSSMVGVDSFQSGCTFLEVCDYTDEVEMPR